MLGQQEIVVRTKDQSGAYHMRRYSRFQDTGGAERGKEQPARGAGEEEGEQNGETMRSILAAVNNAPGWHAPRVARSGQAANMRMQYSVPLRYGNTGEIFGVLTLTMSMPWFEDRIKAIRELEGSTLFLLGPQGVWTLPSSLIRAGADISVAETDLALLKARMEKLNIGSMFLNVGQDRYIAVFAPLSMDNFMLGVLIPRDLLLGALDGLTRTLACVGLVVLGLSLYFMQRTTRAMLRPLRLLGETAARLAREDFSAPPLPSGKAFFSRGDEPSRLMHAAEHLRHTLRESVRDLTLHTLIRERLTGELALARTIQDGLRSRELPAGAAFLVSARLERAREVCGEMYDCFFITPLSLCCIMGSVAARGVPAALLMGRVMPLLHENLLAGISPGIALENCARIIARYGPDGSDAQSQLVTVFAGIVNIANGHMVWASAGQRPPFRVRSPQNEPEGLANAVSQLPWTKDLPLGVATGGRYTEWAIPLSPGDLLFFCNERLLATPGPDGSPLGEAALTSLLAEHAREPETLVDAVSRKVFAHSGGGLREDLAMLALRWNGGPGVSSGTREQTAC